MNRNTLQALDDIWSKIMSSNTHSILSLTDVLPNVALCDMMMPVHLTRNAHNLIRSVAVRRYNIQYLIIWPQRQKTYLRYMRPGKIPISQHIRIFYSEGCKILMWKKKTLVRVGRFLTLRLNSVRGGRKP